MLRYPQMYIDLIPPLPNGTAIEVVDRGCSQVTYFFSGKLMDNSLPSSNSLDHANPIKHSDGRLKNLICSVGIVRRPLHAKEA